MDSWSGISQGGRTAGNVFLLQPTFSVVVLTVGAPSFRVRTQGGLEALRGVRPLGQSSCSHSASLSPVVEVLSECRLLAYISQVPTQMSFLFRLINIIHVQTLTQVRPAALPQPEGDGKWVPPSP